MEKNRKLDSFVGLKGLLALVIMWFHTLPETPLINAIPLTSLIRKYGGTFGNEMFFMLSGFLIAYGYRERIGRKEISFRRYIWKRLCKLYPLYLITNLVAILTSVMQHGMSAINIRRIVLTLTLQLGGGLEYEHPYNGPTWFLSALFVCYILFFAIAFYSKNSTQYCGMIVLGIVWGYTAEFYGWSRYVPFSYGGGYMGFFTGCMLAFGYPLLSRHVHKWLRPISLIALAFSGYLCMHYGVEIICGDSKIAFVFFFCPLILYMALECELCALVLQSRLLRGLGSISMSVYFWHFEIYVVFRYFYTHIAQSEQIGDTAYLAYMLLTLLCAALSHVLIENKLQIRSLANL